MMWVALGALIAAYVTGVCVARSAWRGQYRMPLAEQYARIRADKEEGMRVNFKQSAGYPKAPDGPAPEARPDEM